MRDYKVYSIEDGGVDLDIIDGEPEYLYSETQTTEQRASLAVYCVKGSLPGQPEFGVSWGTEFSQQNTITTLNNEIQQQLNDCASVSDPQSNNAASTPTALLIPQDSGTVGVLIMRGQI